MSLQSIEFGSPGSSNTTKNPSWTDVESHLRSLNGETKDGVILDSSGKSYMGISGGRNNQYLVAGYIEGRGSFIFASGKQGGGTEQVVVNGDFNTCTLENVACLEDAVAAAKVFYEKGALAEQFKWENQPQSAN